MRDLAFEFSQQFLVVDLVDSLRGFGFAARWGAGLHWFFFPGGLGYRCRHRYAFWEDFVGVGRVRVDVVEHEVAGGSAAHCFLQLREETIALFALFGHFSVGLVADKSRLEEVGRLEAVVCYFPGACKYGSFRQLPPRFA